MKAAGIDTAKINNGTKIEINGTTYTIADVTAAGKNELAKADIETKLTENKINTINGKEYAVGTVEGYKQAGDLYTAIGSEIKKLVLLELIRL